MTSLWFWWVFVDFSWSIIPFVLWILFDIRERHCLTVTHRNIFAVQQFGCNCICQMLLANIVAAIQSVWLYLCWMPAANDWRWKLDYYLCLVAVGGTMKGMLVALEPMRLRNSMVHRRLIFVCMLWKRIRNNVAVSAECTRMKRESMTSYVNQIILDAMPHAPHGKSRFDRKHRARKYYVLWPVKWQSVAHRRPCN